MEKEIIVDKEVGNSLEDRSIYSEDFREQILEDDELSPMESAFMKGYDTAYIQGYH